MPRDLTTDRKRFRLRDLTITEISAVRRGANEGAVILIAKAADTATRVRLSVAKADDDQRYIAGWASIVAINGEPVVDREGDTIDEETLTAAAHRFMREFRVGKSHHKGADLIEYTESLVMGHDVQEAMGVDLGHTGWWIGGFVRDDRLWEKIKKGEVRGLSVGGTGVREVAKGGTGRAMTFSQVMAARGHARLSMPLPRPASRPTPSPAAPASVRPASSPPPLLPVSKARMTGPEIAEAAMRKRFGLGPDGITKAAGGWTACSECPSSSTCRTRGACGLENTSGHVRATTKRLLDRIGKMATGGATTASTSRGAAIAEQRLRERVAALQGKGA